MHECSKDIVDLLEEEFGWVAGKELFISREPVSPADCITVYDTAGTSESSLNAQSTYHVGTIQIRHRNKMHEKGMEIAWGIYEFLHNKHQFSINGIYYGGVLATSDPIVLKWDEHGRVIIIIDFETQRRKE